MTWTILIASAYVRTRSLVALLEHLAPQLEACAGDVTVLIDRDDCDTPIGDKRTRLVRAATSDYVCFVDDDDWVPDSYVDRIMQALDPHPDYVGFRMQLIHDGVPAKPTFHSIVNQRWWEDDRGYYRHISHLNPIRRELALLGLPFPSAYPEDGEWADRVFQSGMVQTESFIDEVMYEYRTGSGVSLHNDGVERHGEFSPLAAFPFVSELPAAERVAA